MAGALIVCVTIFLSYRYAQRLGNALGRNGTAVLMRISAFVLFCIGVQITWNGARTLATEFHAPPVVRAPAKAS